MSTNGPAGNNEDSKIGYENEMRMKTYQPIKTYHSIGFASGEHRVIFSTGLSLKCQCVLYHVAKYLC